MTLLELSLEPKKTPGLWAVHCGNLELHNPQHLWEGLRAISRAPGDFPWCTKVVFCFQVSLGPIYNQKTLKIALELLKISMNLMPKDGLVPLIFPECSVNCVTHWVWQQKCLDYLFISLKSIEPLPSMSYILKAQANFCSGDPLDVMWRASMNSLKSIVPLLFESNVLNTFSLNFPGLPLGNILLYIRINFSLVSSPVGQSFRKPLCQAY